MTSKSLCWAQCLALAALATAGTRQEGSCLKAELGVSLPAQSTLPSPPSPLMSLPPPPDAASNVHVNPVPPPSSASPHRQDQASDAQTRISECFMAISTSPYALTSDLSISPISNSMLPPLVLPQARPAAYSLRRSSLPALSLVPSQEQPPQPSSTLSPHILHPPPPQQRNYHAPPLFPSAVMPPHMLPHQRLTGALPRHSYALTDHRPSVTQADYPPPSGPPPGPGLLLPHTAPYRDIPFVPPPPHHPPLHPRPLRPPPLHPHLHQHSKNRIKAVYDGVLGSSHATERTLFVPPLLTVPLALHCLHIREDEDIQLIPTRAQKQRVYSESRGHLRAIYDLHSITYKTGDVNADAVQVRVALATVLGDIHHLPFSLNLSTPEYIPTRMLSLLRTLRTHFPRRRLLLLDFSSLQDVILGVSASRAGVGAQVGDGVFNAWLSQVVMSEPLKYQECYRKPAHTSVINAIVLSHDGCRFITGSDDSTVLMWSTQNGSILCRIKTHSPVLSLAWVGNSSGFLLGCENGTGTPSLLIDSTSVLTVTTPQSLLYHQRLMTSFQYLQPGEDVKIWIRRGQTEQQMESWELKVKLASPGLLQRRHQEVEVTSVNWESRDAAASASHVLVSYRWHGIMCWDVTTKSVLWWLPMEECSTLSLSSDGKFATTFGLSKAFEVQELRSGTVQRLQWQGPIIPAPEPRHVGKLKLIETQVKLIKDKPVCFAHEGFAVASAAGGNKVHVWDAKRGDELLSLDHGKGSKVHSLVTAFLREEDKFLIITGTEKHGKNYIFVWVTVLRSGTTCTNAGQSIELNITRSFWVNVLFIVASAALLSWWVMHVSRITVT
ncbi:WD40-repeat-containing domain protein [Russula emetica]|nr:WD40-repeat-containing domain protein [Russula emetica]